MPIPEIQRLLVGAVLTTYCERKVSPGQRRTRRVDYRFDGNSVVLDVSRRKRPKARWNRTPVARFRYLVGKKLWVLDRPAGRGRWRRHDGCRPNRDFRVLLAAVEDHADVFWPPA